MKAVMFGSSMLPGVGAQKGSVDRLGRNESLFDANFEISSQFRDISVYRFYFGLPLCFLII